jgi:hypothetical protein
VRNVTSTGPSSRAATRATPATIVIPTSTLADATRSAVRRPPARVGEDTGGL